MRLPNEIILLIGECLPLHDLYSLTLVNHRFTTLFRSHLHSLATHPSNALTALTWAVISNDEPFSKYIITHGPVSFTEYSRLLSFASTSVPLTLRWMMPRGDDGQKISVIEWAVKTSHYGILRLALNKHVYGRYGYRDLEVAQREAVELGDQKAAQILLEYKVATDAEEMLLHKAQE